MARIPRRGIKLPKTKQPCGHGWDKLDQGCMACIAEQKTLTLGSCVWCEWVHVKFGAKSLEKALKAHVLKECKKHPMRKLERKIARLEKRR
jgi:hypothetical protein